MSSKITRLFTIRGIILIVLIVLVVIALRFRPHMTVTYLEKGIGEYGTWAPLVFILIYSVAPSLFLPGSIFALAGGVLFGPVHGSIYSLIAATIGATAAFFIARYITSKWVVKKVDNKLKKITAGVNAAGWRFVAFIRLVPLIPFNLANYALGLTNIKASHYIAASFVCMAPGAIVYSYLGYAGREILGGGKSQLVKILFALSFFAAFSLLPGLVKRFFPTEAGTFIDQEKS